MALTAIKKWMKEHDPNKPVKPGALGKGTRKVSTTKKKTTDKAKAPPKKTTTKKTTTKKTTDKVKNVPIPAQKPRSGKTAQVASEKVIKQEKPKDKRPSLGIVPKGRQYKSAGVVKSLGILPKRDKKEKEDRRQKDDRVTVEKKKRKSFLGLFGG